MAGSRHHCKSRQTQQNMGSYPLGRGAGPRREFSRCRGVGRISLLVKLVKPLLPPFREPLPDPAILPRPDPFKDQGEGIAQSPQTAATGGPISTSTAGLSSRIPVRSEKLAPQAIT